MKHYSDELIIIFEIFQIEKIRIGHDGSKPGAGWFLDEVRIDVPSQGKYTQPKTFRLLESCHRVGI